MSKNFAQVLKEHNIDIKIEYTKLFNILYTKIYKRNTRSIYDLFNRSFPAFFFRGTCLSLQEFDEMHKYHFVRDPEDFNIDYLVRFCEYFYNLLMGYQCADESRWRLPDDDINTALCIDQILAVIESIGYTSSTEDGLTIFVEKSSAAIAAAQCSIIPSDLSYRIIRYNHYSMNGEIEKKKHTILELAGILEAKKNLLIKANSELKKDLFFLFNNLDIRHNNTDPDNTGKYKKYVAKMDKSELEKWYDETYQMTLLAVLELEHIERKKEFDNLKKKIIDSQVEKV